VSRTTDDVDTLARWLHGANRRHAREAGSHAESPWLKLNVVSKCRYRDLAIALLSTPPACLLRGLANRAAP
jgi:hypothetical protein